MVSYQIIPISNSLEVRVDKLLKQKCEDIELQSVTQSPLVYQKPTSECNLYAVYSIRIETRSLRHKHLLN